MYTLSDYQLLHSNEEDPHLTTDKHIDHYINDPSSYIKIADKKHLYVVDELNCPLVNHPECFTILAQCTQVGCINSNYHIHCALCENVEFFFFFFFLGVSFQVFLCLYRKFMKMKVIFLHICSKLILKVTW